LFFNAVYYTVYNMSFSYVSLFTNI
jgi:hypothetical protein